MRKLACDLPVDAGRGTDGDGGDARLVQPRSRAAPDLLVALHGALEDRKRITFRYHTMSSDATGRREAEPFGLFFLNGHWYLAARAPGNDLVKNFRLNRMADVEVNRAKPGTPDYEIPARFRIREHAGSRQAWELGAGDAVEAVVAAVRGGAAAAALRLGEGAHASDDGTVTLEITWTGTHRGPLQTPAGPIAATGKRIDIPSCAIVELKGNKARAQRHYFDMTTMLRQIGVAG
jgi:hypothetical protein